MNESPKDRICGTVLRTTFHNKENDYRVVKLQPLESVEPSKLDSRGEVVLVGALPGIEVGEYIEAEGRWAIHPKHGPQFKADWFKPTLPSGTLGIEAYLASGSFKGVGKALARRITAAFGERTLEILDNDIESVRGVKGITRRTFEAIKNAWREGRGDRELVTFLGDHGIAPSWANRLGKTYGEAALSIIRSNPYRLAAEVRGVGFSRADAMARRIGIAADAPERIDAALGHVLEEQAGDGHTFLPKEALVNLATELLKLDQTRVEERLELMINQSRLSCEEMQGGEAVFLNALREAEEDCARSLIELAAAKHRVPVLDLERTLENFERNSRFELSETQRQAVFAIAREGMMALTGGPGTGKTTTLRAVIHLFQRGERIVRLAAPTGRAARRLAETSHMQAETIHRLLGFQARTGGFSFNSVNPLEADLVIVDEASMLDAPLARDLLRAIGKGTCLLLVGDEDQLPSVGPGNVLRDVIASQIMPVARLTEIFRQAQSSLIVVNAHRINRGEAPLFRPPAEMKEPDFFFIERQEPAEVLETIRTLVAERIPAKYRLDPLRDIQVLTPMRRGELGVHSINRELQAVLNPLAQGNPRISPEPTELFADEEGGREALRVGDRVMQTANNYDKEVFNGDVGTIESANGETGELIVAFEGRKVSYLSDEASQLALAYAITIHKSQGSEYRAVVIPMHTSHYIMLRRNLLYTALTRGRDLVCIVGMKQAVWRAVRDTSRQQRNSALEFFLRKKQGEELAPDETAKENPRG